MINRYTLPEMGGIWTDEARYRKWLAVEVAVCEVLAGRGEMPKKAYLNIKKKANINVKRIEAIEEKTKHDVIAFKQCVDGYIGKDSIYFHRGLTSSDVLDTGLALQLQAAADILIKDIKETITILKKKTKQYKDLPMMGRTHGVHAEPTTFGLKLAIWWKEMERNLVRMERARETISYGKISGAVGTFSNIDPVIEVAVCKKLGLKNAAVSNQVIQRDRHAEYLSVIAIIASSLDKFATEIRHLQRTEVYEAEEPFAKGQKGSSAMPHKRNPITCERISGLARLLRANAITGYENIALWHERDISHSSVERVTLPDSTITLDYMLHKFNWLLDNLNVYPENMMDNLNKMQGLMYSQKVRIALTNKGMIYDQAYQLVQDSAMRVWKKEGSFKELLLKDPRVSKYLTPDELEACFDMNAYLKNVKKVFKRLGV
ncbi:MAG: adenylosuccinate lyase [Candidatus Firestonebacteria bacterium RIFOXYA2_FULL_40_8]|nr:MAG: adenylosuccinate lyase [Candidatus Firestonebacteria bacterium RIFOXYA2_FULL_40_8]